MADSSRNSQTSVVVVAIVGLISTIGAAALGGYWANQSVERQFESQRGAQIQDQRREVYADFLRSTVKACEAQERAVESGNDAEATATANEVVTQGGLVVLIAGSTEVEVAVSDFMDAVAFDDACAHTDRYIGLYNDFGETARNDLT
jgi:hypothetical protein